MTHDASARVSAIALLAIALLLYGCAQGDLDRLLGKGPVAEGAPRPAYAAVDRAKVHSHPETGSAVLGLLALHEKITRYQSEGGFAYVEAAHNLTGWVRESELATARARARKPAEPAPTPAPATPPAEPATSAGQPSEAQPAPPPEEPGAEEPDPDENEAPPGPDAEPERSVFDPY